MDSLRPGDTIPKHSIVVVASDQLSSDLSGEVVILNLKSGTYYGLNTMGARIWNLLQQPKAVDELQKILLDEYEVEVDRCESDLQALLQELAANGLVEVKDEATT